MTRTGINPTPAQISEIAGSDVTGEIVMLNLLRFSDAPQEYGRYEETELPLDQEQRAGAGTGTGTV